MIKDCPPDKCKRRDNNYGITWCVKCGRLFTKPSGKELQESDKIILPINNNPSPQTAKTHDYGRKRKQARISL